MIKSALAIAALAATIALPAPAAARERLTGGDRGTDAPAGAGDDRDLCLGRGVRRVGSHAVLPTGGRSVAAGRPALTGPD